MDEPIVGIYVRISRDRDGLKAGVGRQQRDCAEYCERRSWTVHGIYQDDDRSAYSGRPRPAYKRLCDALKDGAVNTIVVWHPDRLHRSPAELESFITLVESTGATVYSVTAGEFDLSTPEGRLMARVVGSVARKESEDKSRRLRRKHQELAESGRPHGGTRAFGYAADGITVISEEAALIRESAAQVLAGISPRAIAARWNADGILTPRGGQWVPQVVRNVLLSPRIRGLRQHRGQVLGPAVWPAIIDRATGAALDATLRDARRVTNGRVNARRNYLAGFVYCSRCGNRLFTGVSNGKLAMLCKKGQVPTSCGRMAIALQPLDDLVRAMTIERLLLSPRGLSRAASGRAGSTSDDEVASELDALRVRLHDLEAMFVGGTVNAEQFARMQANIEERQEALLAVLNQGSARYVLEAVPPSREELLEAWNANGLDYRRALVGLVFSSIEILPAPHKGARFTPVRVRPFFRALAGVEPA